MSATDYFRKKLPLVLELEPNYENGEELCKAYPYIAPGRKREQFIIMFDEMKKEREKERRKEKRKHIREFIDDDYSGLPL